MAWYTALDKMIGDYLPDLEWVCDEPMEKHTSFRIGGPARRMAFPKTREQLVVLAGLLQEAGIEPLLLGNGTNLLVADEGLDTVVINTSAQLSRVEQTGECELTADAGVSLCQLALFAWKQGLAGLAFAHGIPGTLGGGVVMNAGAYGGELKDVIADVTALYPDGVRTLTADEMGFSYRHSALEDTGDIVLSARFTLTPDSEIAIRERMKELMAKRSASQPLDMPSAGSAFKRPVGGYAAALIDGAGLKGFTVGGAAISTKHAGFAVNLGDATAADVRGLLSQVSDRVFAQTGIRLEPEVRIW